MGCGTWTSSSWDSYKRTKGIDSTSTVKDIYSRELDDSMNPRNVSIRESCDSDEHPNSNAIILGLDVTGSMGHLAEQIAKESLNTLITEIYNNESLVDPQIMIAAIGDTYYDDAPLQVSQFESDIRIAESLSKIYFEAGGGGNEGESYLALYYFAARHTSIDCMNKRNKKGVLYTIGDEPCLDILPSNHIAKVFGDTNVSDVHFDDIFNEVSKSYDVYHIVANGSWHDRSLSSWREKIGERAMFIKDITKIPQVIETTLELKMGKKLDDILDKYDKRTAMVVLDSVGALANSEEKLATIDNTNNKLVEF